MPLTRAQKIDKDKIKSQIGAEVGDSELEDFLAAQMDAADETWDDESAGQPVADQAIPRFFEALSQGRTDLLGRMGGEAPIRSNLTGRILLSHAIADLDPKMSAVEAAAKLYGSKSTVVDAIETANQPRKNERTLAEAIASREVEGAAKLSGEDFGHGGALWRPTMSKEIIEAAEPYLVLDQLRPRRIPLPPGGLKMGRLRSGTTAHYTNERPQAKLISQAPKTDQLNFREHTLQVFLPVPKAWVRSAANGEGVGLMETELQDMGALGMARRKNMAWLLDDGTLDTPKGLLHHTVKGVNRYAAYPGSDLGPVLKTLVGMWASLARKDIRHARPAFITNPLVVAYLMGHALDGMQRPYFAESLGRGQLLGADLAHTTQIPFNLGAMGDLSLIFRVEMAEVFVANAAHVEVRTVVDTAYDDGTGMTSTTQGGEVVILIEETHDFQLAHQDAVCVCAPPWANQVGLPPSADI